MGSRQFIIGSDIVAAGLAGGSVAASDYPPDVPPPTTVLVSSQSGASRPTALQRPGPLPETGSDSGTLVKIAGGAIVAGAGLVVVTRRRRHPAAAAERMPGRTGTAANATSGLLIGIARHPRRARSRSPVRPSRPATR